MKNIVWQALLWHHRINKGSGAGGGGGLNIKVSSCRYRDLHDKDIDDLSTVSSLSWESPYRRDWLYIDTGPSSHDPMHQCECNRAAIRRAFGTFGAFFPQDELICNCFFVDASISSIVNLLVTYGSHHTPRQHLLVWWDRQIIMEITSIFVSISIKMRTWVNKSHTIIHEESR